MSTCMKCRGTRENNILKHKPDCPFYRETAKAVVEAGRNDERRAERERLDAIAKPDALRENPHFAELEVALDSWYPAA